MLLTIDSKSMLVTKCVYQTFLYFLNVDKDNRSYSRALFYKGFFHFFKAGDLIYVLEDIGKTRTV